MDKEQINILDGSKEQREKIVKEFLGLKPDQSFQDLNINENELKVNKKD